MDALTVTGSTLSAMANRGFADPSPRSSSFGGGFNVGGLLGGIGGFLTQNAYAKANKASAKSARREAGMVLKRAKWETTRLRRFERSLLGSQRFMAARAGIAMTGTAKDVQEFTQKQIDIDDRQIRENAGAQYVELMEQAKTLEKAAKTSGMAGVLNLVGGALSSIEGGQ